MKNESPSAAAQDRFDSSTLNRHYDVLHFSESAGRYVHPPGGTPTRDIMELVRPELRVALRSGLYQAFTEEKASMQGPMLVQFNGAPRPIHVAVRPAKERADTERLALVIFIEDEAAEELPEPEEPGKDLEARQLEEELRKTRQRLQKTIEEYEASNEELRAANEELQSMNEEYRSTTEELETSQEELQSVNEELQTVNSELKAKIEEISQAHSDLENLIRATEIGVLFLDRGLNIKRFTPRAQRHFNLRENDRGRPISDLTHNLNYDELEPDSREVLRDLSVIEREVQDEEGRWYLVRLRPYRTVEDKIDGVVITFVDITERREAEKAQRKAEERYQLLMQNVQEYAIFIMDPEGTITTWSAGAERLFGYSAEEAIGRSGAIIFTEEDRASGIPERELEEAARTGQASDERWHLCKDGDRFWGTGTTTALYHSEADAKDPSALRGFAKVLRDNTKRKQAEEALRELNETLEERVQERTREVRELASKLTMAEQEERRRISQILHDNLQQMIYGIQMRMSFARRDAEAGAQEKVLEHIEEADKWTREAIETTRQLTIDLSPPVLQGEGLADSLDWLRTQMEERHGLKVEVKEEQPINIPDEDMRVLLFQSVRELLFNVVKHAGVDRATVEIQPTGEHLVIRVIDEGKGFDPEEQASQHEPESGLGLFSVQERLGLFGGRMEIDSAPGKGTRVTLHAPVEPQAPDASEAQ